MKLHKLAVVGGLIGIGLVGTVAVQRADGDRAGAGAGVDREAYEAMLAEHPFATRPRMDRAALREIPKKDRPDLALEQDVLRTMDPATGVVPRERLYAANRLVSRIQDEAALRGGEPLVTEAWAERGPTNVAGRTRAVLFDPNDSTGRKVWAAGVAGGLWYTDDITTDNPSGNWTAVDDFWANLAVTALAFDPTDTQVVYAGTGEGFYNLDAVRGAGIFKSVDGGLTWNQLTATAGNSSFYYVQRIAVHPTTGDVYAATRSGVFRSQDDGASWTNVQVGAAADVEIAADGTIYATTGIFTIGRIYASTTGDSGSWTQLNNGSNGLPSTGVQRIEIAIAPSDPLVVYAVTQSSTTYGVGGVYRTTDGGTTWTTLTMPDDEDPGMTEFSRGQAWYDLSLAVDPNDENTAFIGGIDLFKTTNGGSTWQQVSHWYGGFGYQEVHADQHAIAFKPGSSDEIVFSHDGGVHYTADGTAAIPTIQWRNRGYNVTQFYGGDIAPEADSDVMVAGAQDNGTQFFFEPDLGETIEARGGDGGFAFVDQTQSSTAISSYVYNTFNSSPNGGISFPTVLINDTGTGSFINPADYDDRENILYTYRTTSSLYRVTGVGTAPVTTTLTSPISFGSAITHVRVSPFAPAGTSTVYVGTQSGRLFRLANAEGTPTVTELTAPPVVGAISCIEFTGDEDHMLVTLSNYGVVSVWETLDGGATWANKEGNLPDVPVRWALFHPTRPNAVILATETGVWETENLQDASPTWTPAPGFPVTRTDMLQTRSSDGMVMAITHGRGVFTAPFRVGAVANEPGAAGAPTHRLSAPAPNPFRDRARFTLSLAEPQHVRLTLLDVQGRRVRLLHDGALAAGEHPFMVEGRGLSGGAYVVAVEGERFRDRVRLTLVR